MNDQPERFASWPDAWPIMIFTGNYNGIFKIDGTGPFRGEGPENKVVVNLLQGSHEISFFSGYFLLMVDKHGNISHIGNPVAATAEGNRLFFQTQEVVIDPGEFGNRGGKCDLVNYPFKSHGLIARAKKPYNLVIGVSHQFDSGARVGQAPEKKLAGSFLSVLVRKDGSVWSNSPAANGGDRLLRLNCGLVTIIPASPELRFEVGVNCRTIDGELDESQRYAGVSTDVPVILGLRTSLYVPLQTIASSGKTYREACGYFNPEYGFHDSHDLIVGDAAFRWRVIPE